MARDTVAHDRGQSWTMCCQDACLSAATSPTPGVARATPEATGVRHPTWPRSGPRRMMIADAAQKISSALPLWESTRRLRRGEGSAVTRLRGAASNKSPLTLPAMRRASRTGREALSLKGRGEEPATGEGNLARAQRSGAWCPPCDREVERARSCRRQCGDRPVRRADRRHQSVARRRDRGPARRACRLRQGRPHLRHAAWRARAHQAFHRRAPRSDRPRQGEAGGHRPHALGRARLDPRQARRGLLREDPR